MSNPATMTLGKRVITTTAKRVTSYYALDTEKQTFDNTITLNGF
jgi:hypothetical protein